MRRLRHPAKVIAFFFAIFLVLLAGARSSGEEKKQTPPKGQRVFTCGHSFHVFVPGTLADVAKGAGVKDHKMAGLSSIGGSRVIQHWNAADITLKGETKAIRVESFSDDGKEVVYKPFGGKQQTKAKSDVVKIENKAKELLGKGEVDVLTLSPIFLPDNGIEKFVELALKNNKDVRITVQENWLPWDVYDPRFKKPAKKVDHDAPTVDELKKMHKPYFESIDEHVRELNKKYKKEAVFVVPVGQAVVALREKILDGKAPGLKKQSDLFTDEIGHAKAPIMALNAYCHYAVIYKCTPVGLPMPAVMKNAKADEKLNTLLQELAWEAVTKHPLSGVKSEK
jgi:hypothetical protein